MLRVRQLKAHLRHHATLINCLRLFSVVVILWLEIGAFFWSLVDCKWPDAVFQQSDSSISPTHILVVADPQVLDERSFPNLTPWLQPIARFVIHLNLRKSWNAVSRLKPHAVIFTGDMINGGRFARTDEEYSQFANTFKSLLPVPKGTPTYYVVGNHDVGLGRSKAFSSQARERFRSNFGPEFQHFQLGNHTLILLDAPGLVEDDYRRSALDVSYEEWTPITGGSVEFVKNYVRDHWKDEQTLPNIMLTHIPLSRPERASCGPLRESTAPSSPLSTIHKGAGSGYQNLLGRATSKWLLEMIRPTLVLSADNHDYCEVVHRFESGLGVGKVREVTVKSINMASGIRRPGFQLLSLWNPMTSMTTTITAADRMCMLPDQNGIYWRGYFVFSLFGVMLLAYVNFDWDGSSLSKGIRRRNVSAPTYLTAAASSSTNRPSSPLWPPSPTLGTRSASFSQATLFAPGTPNLRRASLAVQNRKRSSSPLASPLQSPLLMPELLEHPDEDEEDEEMMIGIVKEFPQSPAASTWSQTPGAQSGWALNVFKPANGESGLGLGLLTSGSTRKASIISPFTRLSRDLDRQEEEGLISLNERKPEQISMMKALLVGRPLEEVKGKKRRFWIRLLWDMGCIAWVANLSLLIVMWAIMR